MEEVSCWIYWCLHRTLNKTKKLSRSSLTSTACDLGNQVLVEPVGWFEATHTWFQGSVGNLQEEWTVLCAFGAEVLWCLTAINTWAQDKPAPHCWGSRWLSSILEFWLVLFREITWKVTFLSDRSDLDTAAAPEPSVPCPVQASISPSGWIWTAGFVQSSQNSGWPKQP